MTVVYVDSVFVLNTVMDYLVVLCTGRLAGIPLHRGRYLLAALVGGAYAVAVFLPGGAFLAETPAKIAAGVLLSVLAFGGEEKLLRLTLLLFAVSCGLAGCVLALGLLAGSEIPAINGIFYTNIDARVLLIAAAAAYLVLNVVFRAAAKHGIGGELLPVRVCIGGRVAELTALWDSGNGLRDPSGGRPVLVAAPGSLDSILPERVQKLLTPDLLRFPADLLEPVRQAAPGLRPRLLPYHAVGMPGGLLLTVRTDWTEIAGTRYPGLPAALSPTELGNGYKALWGGEVRKGERHEPIANPMETAAGKTWASAGAGHPLYRRKRYAAAAPEQGAGGGVAEPPGPGGRPEGAHRT